MELFGTVFIETMFFVYERFALQIFEQIDSQGKIDWSLLVNNLNLATFRLHGNGLILLDHLDLLLQLFDVCAISSTC